MKWEAGRVAVETQVEMAHWEVGESMRDETAEPGWKNSGLGKFLSR